ncbi:MAG: hypothetical protein AMDU3_IPLC00004G0019 [Thermoplasmatales archaeon I-plasma]|jgi:hypothetical protein|nr:MAG: hypothetical protein AMDU3_IPLC00004G0019 [Thermoplasmatales archaeon I-plasma]
MSLLYEKKADYANWRAIVMRSARDRTPVRAFAEVEGKESVTILCPEDGRVVKRLMPTERWVDPAKDNVDNLETFCIYGHLMSFRGMVRVGDVLDVGEGGTSWDKTIRYGVVDEWGDVVYLINGSEKDIMEALQEVSKIVLTTEEENKIKVDQYLHDDPEYDYMFKKVMGYPAK